MILTLNVKLPRVNVALIMMLATSSKRQGSKEVCEIVDQRVRGGQGSKGWDQGSEGWDLGTQPRDRDQQFLKGSDCTFFVRSGAKISLAFGFKDPNFGCKNGIRDETTYLVANLKR